MRYLVTVLAMALTLNGQTAGGLNLVIVQGEGAINNIRQRTAREPIVQVEDENHRPIAGVAVVFTLPSSGPSATFPGGVTTLTTTTNDAGQVVARGLQPNQVQGNFQIRVTASRNGQTASATISQANVLGAAAATAGAAGISGKLIGILIGVGAAAAAGTVIAVTRNGNNTPNTPPVAAVTISAGTGTVGPPR